MVLVLSYKVCICIGTLLVGCYVTVEHDSARAALTFSPATQAMLSQGNGEEVCGPYRQDLQLMEFNKQKTMYSCLNPRLCIHSASATLREHLLRVTVCLDTPMTQEATHPYTADLIV